MTREKSPENFSTWLVCHRSCTDDYHSDDDDSVTSIWKMLTCPTFQTDDPRYLSHVMRDRLVKNRIAQMEREAEANIAALRSLGRDNAVHDDGSQK